MSEGALDYVSNGQYKYLKWVGPLPFGNPSTGFHNYSIHYMPTYFAYYADGSLLGSFNSTTATKGLPDSTMAVKLYISAATTTPSASDAMWVQSVSFKQADGTALTCPAKRSDESSAARLEGASIRWIGTLWK
jgi:hypothetical protein